MKIELFIQNGLRVKQSFATGQHQNWEMDKIKFVFWVKQILNIHVP